MKINVRETGIVEIVCPHGVGHPSELLTRQRGTHKWRKVDSVHGCCGCCATVYFRKREKQLAGANDE